MSTQPTSAHKITKHTLDIPGTNKKLEFEIEHIPVSAMPSTYTEKDTNVAKVDIGGQEFFLSVGKTNVL